MPYSIPTVDDFKAQFPPGRDFYYAVPAYGASASATLTSGALTALAVVSGGQNYTAAPLVTITTQPGDTGGGATATASVSGGKVSGFTIGSPGSGYHLPPIVSFAGGAGDDTNPNRVQDEDVAGAILDAQFNVNPGLFTSQQFFTRAFLYAAAHQLIERLKMMAAGVQSQYSWLVNSKSVADVSMSFEIPPQIKDTPFLAHFSTTRYGAMYLQIITPLLVGNMQTDETFTNP